MKKYIGLILGLLPLSVSAQIVMTGNYYVVLSGGSQSHPTSLVLTNAGTPAITNTGTGWIVSENEFNQVDWKIGNVTGNYVVPFGYGTTDYLPLTCNITTAGVGGTFMKFATYHCATWDNTLYEPSDVTNMSDYGSPDYSKSAVDRFWIVDASGYTTKPTADLSFTFIGYSSGDETAAPNYIVGYSLLAQRFNSGSAVWTDFQGTTNTYHANGNNTATVTSGNVTPANFYRSWCVFNDSAEVNTGVASVTGSPNAISVYPNPSNGSFTVRMAGTGKSTFMVYDVLGQQLFSQPLMAGSNTVATGIRANGMYLYRVLSDTGELLGEGKLILTK